VQPATRYARSGDIRTAYQVFGEGPINVVLAPPFVSTCSLFQPERLHDRPTVPGADALDLQPQHHNVQTLVKQ
jgi:hypothetical protein